jgi:hypothetical protein
MALLPPDQPATTVATDQQQCHCWRSPTTLGYTTSIQETRKLCRDYGELVEEGLTVGGDASGPTHDLMRYRGTDVPLCTHRLPPTPVQTMSNFGELR